jgi:hypothetical protein
VLGTWTVRSLCRSDSLTLQEVGEGRGDWMELAQDRDGALPSTVKNFRVP